MASSKVVVDVLDQCAAIGDLHHAITRGLMLKSDIHGELGDVVTNRIAGRENEDEIIVFDSTGTALEDVAAAVRVYRKAVSANWGRLVDFGN
jgi:ornithine cyclodeaminase/alanine dehydrogenase-like protein (mu-crystallin family)